MKVNEGMKKVFSILLCLCMVLTLVPTSAFAAETDDLCEHPSYSTESVPETCTTQGYDIHTCIACGDSYIEYHSYSEWSAERPAGIEDDLIQTATQYRSADKDVKISSESAMDGYTLVETTWNSGSQQTNAYANFAGTGFSATNALYEQYCHPVFAFEDENRKIVLDSEAKTGYLYYHWCYVDSYYSVEARSGSYTTFHAYYDTTSPDTYTCDTSDMSYKTSHSSCSDSGWWFVLDVSTQSYTVYDRVNVFKKLGEWSAWDFAEIQPTDTCEVETREVYRYANGMPSHDFGTDGICTTCGEACIHTGGTATCKETAVCGLCGESYGDKDPNNHASNEFTYTDNKNDTHTKAHECCGVTFVEKEAHTFDTTTGKCACGVEMAAASTTVDSTTTYYLTIQPALDAAAQAESAVVELLRSDENVTGLTMFSGNVRLVMNGWTLKGNVSNNGILQLFGTKLTVDGGTIENTAQDGYGVYAAYNDDTHRYSTISLIGSDVTGIRAGICTYKAHVEVADSTVTGTEYGICAQNAGGINLESGTISGKIGVQTSMNGGTVTLGAEGTTGPTIYGKTHGIYSNCDTTAYSGTVSCPEGIGIVLGEHYSGPNESAGAGLILEGTPTINASTDIYLNYTKGLVDNRCIQVNVELTDGAYSVNSWVEYEVIAKPGKGITLKRTWFTSTDPVRFVQYGMHGYLTLAPCAHGEKRGVQNEDGLTHDIFCNICLTTPEEDVACSGGTATCTSKATCTVCGELYGEVEPHAEDEDVGQTCKGYFCTVCRAFYGATVADSHRFDSTTGKCGLCKNDLAVASTTVGGIDTYYQILAEAIKAAAAGTEDAPATVTVLKNIDITETIEVESGVFTLNLNGKTLRDYENDGLFDGIFSLPYESTAHMTIADTEGGKLLADWGAIQVEDGTVTITGGELNYAGATALGDSVSVYGGTVNISGGTIHDVSTHEGMLVITDGSIDNIHVDAHTIVNISGGNIQRLHVSIRDSRVKLSGGEFWEIYCRENATSGLLADGYSYWNWAGNIMLNPADDTVITEVTVKATCYHPEEKLSYTVNSDGTHTWSCSGCASTGTESHLYPVDTHMCVCGTVEKFMATWTDGDGGSYEKEFKYGETIMIPTNEFFQDTFRKTGYTVASWEGYLDGMTMPAGNVTFTAIYEANVYTITFDTDGGSGVTPITQAYGTAVTAPAAPSKDGYHFVKWEDLPAAMPAGDLTVKAVWEAHFGGEATCVSGKICEGCSAEYTEVDTNIHSLLFTVSQDGATCTVSCDLCQEVLETATMVAPACKVYGDGNSCEVTALHNGVPVGTLYGVVYFRWENGQWNKLETAPADAGTYRAETYNGISTPDDPADDVTLYVEYTIEKARLTVTANNNSITYGDAPAANGVTARGFVSGETFADLSGELTYTCDYEQFGDVGTYAITPGGVTSDNYAITFAEGELIVNAKAITVTADAVSKTYGDADPALTYEVEGLVNGDALTGELNRVPGENVGSYDIQQNTLTADGNYRLSYTGAKLTIGKRNITITPKDQTVTYGGAISNTEITAVGLVDGHSVTAALTPSTANVTADGTITASAAVITANGNDVTANYEISYGAPAKLVIEPDTSKIAGLTTENVTSANKTDIKAVQEMMANADSVKEEWDGIAATCEALMAKIEAAADATDTENTEKVEDVTADNVKPEDKEALEDAKLDLEKALEDNAGNYTEEEKQAIQDEIGQIEAAIETLENARDVTESINALPESVKPDDEAAAEKILEAKDAYDALTDHEKSLAGEDVKKKLDDLLASLTAYDIVEGDGGKWTKGGDGSLRFTANGAFSKFVGIEVDGKEVDKESYQAKSGSTIITLKQSYLEKLSTGEHTITVVYTDGETSGTFIIQAGSVTPATGDHSNIMLYGAVFAVSLAAIVVLLLARKKRKQENA